RVDCPQWTKLPPQPGRATDPSCGRCACPTSVIALRPIEDGDIEARFEQQRDPSRCTRSRSPQSTRTIGPRSTLTWLACVGPPHATIHAVTGDGTLVGSVASFVREGEPEVTYWALACPPPAPWPAPPVRGAWRRGVAG